ncbi:RHS repeat-associated core domain-containing protein [Desulfobulbus propionicus]|uniref:RHS repeat-associated core domain-containing protein n=1 Tax=Desulfobulbus propionicus TaxID=894 RepID=UPI002350C95F|nr:RHS repeat-associated core domain-containing protein [Desulfobulbus propionicus]
MARATLLQGGAALANTQVVAISDSDPDHPQSLTSDASGVAELRLPAGSYTFKATLGETVYQGIGTVLADQTTNVTLNLGTSTLSITVRKNETTVLPGVVCSLYTAEGEPLDRSATTDGSGVASFAVEAGTYRVQARYLGYDFTSEVIETPAVLAASLTIPYRDLAVRVLKDQGQGTEPVSGLRCYLYSLGEGEGLNATGLHADSDDQGMVHFVVPEERAYYAVATLLGREFISVESEGQATLTIELGTMTVTVRDDSAVTEANPDGLVQGAVVELYTSEGTALGQELSTGADGQVCFTLPEGSYKLRVGYNDQQFWSGVINTYPLGNTPVEMVNGSGGILSRLHDPHPSLWHGTPPEYRPLLALTLGSLAGMLTTTSTPVAATPQVVYYLNDHLGTAQLLVDATGIVIWQGDAQPFGQVTEVINQIDHRFRFPGQMVDPESGLHYNWNRFYDPATGRYLSPDPIGLDGGTNLYGYVGGDPVNSIDPLGLFNPTKGIASLGNAANAGRLYAGGVLKLGAAAGLTSTGLGAPAGTGVAALGTWNLWSAQSAWNRSLQQWNEAWNESWDDATWKNLLGILPFGTEFDDPCEPSAWDVLKAKAKNFKDKPDEIIREIGTWGF